MAAVCDICGKKPSFGMNVSHSHRRTKRRWNPNIQRVRAVVNGAPKRLHVCTSCIRAGKVTKPLRRTPETTSPANSSRVPSSRRGPAEMIGAARAASDSVAVRYPTRCCQPIRSSGRPRSVRADTSSTTVPV